MLKLIISISYTFDFLGQSNGIILVKLVM